MFHKNNQSHKCNVEKKLQLKSQQQKKNWKKSIGKLLEFILFWLLSWVKCTILRWEKRKQLLDENRIRFYFLLLHFKDFNEEKGRTEQREEKTILKRLNFYLREREFSFSLPHHANVPFTFLFLSSLKQFQEFYCFLTLEKIGKIFSISWASNHYNLIEISHFPSFSFVNVFVNVSSTTSISLVG